MILTHLEAARVFKRRMRGEFCSSLSLTILDSQLWKSLSLESALLIAGRGEVESCHRFVI